MTERVTIGVIGGSGLYNMPEISDIVPHQVDTPFGDPSGDIMVGTLRGKRVAFLPRHGIGHIHTPSTVPYRANIYALKSLGVKFIISVNACGSLRQDFAPGHIVIPDQLFDYTTETRPRSFFESGLVAHISVAEPFCTELGEQLADVIERVGGTAHRGGTFLIEEGPRFATRGESNIFRSWGCDIIGMTACPEAFLAREAEIAYASMAHITDYDVWHETEAPVTLEMVLAQLQRNIETLQQAIALTVEELDEATSCACHTALDTAITTARESISPEMRERLRPLVSRVLGD